MYKVYLVDQRNHGKYYDEIGIFHEEYYAREFVDAIKSKLYNEVITIVKESHKNEKVIYKSRKS